VTKTRRRSRASRARFATQDARANASLVRAIIAIWGSPDPDASRHVPTSREISDESGAPICVVRAHVPCFGASMAKISWCVGLVGLVVVACGGSGAEVANGSATGDPGRQEAFSNGVASDGGGGATSGEKACATDADCGAGGTCNPATKTCACGGAAVPAELIQPNLLVVLDRSCSMTSVVSAGKSKWAIAVGALEKLLATNTGKIRFGLELFPDTTGASCTQDALAVPVAPGKEAAISGMLTASLAKTNPLYPDGPCVTNIDTGMQAAQGEPSFQDKTRSSFVVLITDGQQAGCSAAGGDKGTTKIITDLHAQGIDTFVVGFGSGVDVAQMNAFAAAGGRPRAGATKFYDAADEPSLDAALATIAKKALGCTMKLAAPPPGNDPTQLYVFFDASPTPVSRDPAHADGWDYDAASDSVTFYGPRCDALRDGTVQKASVVVGCPGGAPPTNPVQ
jgi:hypothetical protein